MKEWAFVCISLSRAVDTCACEIHIYIVCGSITELPEERKEELRKRERSCPRFSSLFFRALFRYVCKRVCVCSRVRPSIYAEEVVTCGR